MNTYKRYRYLQVIISHAIWLYHRFTLSLRDIEELMACRGIVVTYETIRQWCLKFTPSFAKSSRKKQGALGDQWFLDEVFVKINGKQQPRKITTDKLASYKAALRDLGCKTPHITKQYQNNIAEISHQKTRQQQRQMRQFSSMSQAQRFLVCHGVINNHFRQQRHLLKARHYRLLRDRAFTQWVQVTCVQNLNIA